MRAWIWVVEITSAALSSPEASTRTALDPATWRCPLPSHVGPLPSLILSAPLAGVFLTVHVVKFGLRLRDLERSGRPSMNISRAEAGAQLSHLALANMAVAWDPP